MDSLGLLVLNIVMQVASCWIITRFLGTIYEKKKINAASILIWMIYLVFQMYIQANNGKASIITTIISFLLVVSISGVSYYRFRLTNFLVVLLLHAVWVLVEMLSFFCMRIVFLQPPDTLGAVISKIIMVIVVYIFSILWKGKKLTLIAPKYYLGLLLMPIGSVFIAAHEFFTQYNAEKKLASMIIFSFLLLFNIIMLEVYSKIAENFVLEKENIVYTQQINMIAKNTEEQKQVMEAFHREKHDLKNKLIVLKNAVEYNDKENALKAIDEMILGNSNNQDMILNSGNKCVDALINTKYATAREKGIRFVLKIFIPEDLPINQYDIGITLGNILDNAIEATEKCENKEKIITIAMGVKKEALVIVVSNPYITKLKKNKSGNLLSTKSDSSKHGYGISSVQKVTEKYHGDVIIEAEDGKFVVTAVMNFVN